MINAYAGCAILSISITITILLFSVVYRFIEHLHLYIRVHNEKLHRKKQAV